MTEPAPGRCPPAWRSQGLQAGVGRATAPVTARLPQVCPATLLLQGTPAVTVHSCHRSSCTQPLKLAAWSVSHLSWVGSGRHSCCRALHFKEGHLGRGRALAGPDLPTPQGTCTHPEAPGWAMHATVHSLKACQACLSLNTMGQDRTLTKVQIPALHPGRAGLGRIEGPKVRGTGPRGSASGIAPTQASSQENLIFSSFFFLEKK